MDMAHDHRFARRSLTQFPTSIFQPYFTGQNACSWPKAVDMAHDHRFIAQIVAPPAVDRPLGEAAARALQLFSVASQGVNNLTKVPTVVISAQNKINFAAC